MHAPPLYPPSSIIKDRKLSKRSQTTWEQWKPVHRQLNVRMEEECEAEKAVRPFVILPSKQDWKEQSRDLLFKENTFSSNP